MVTPLQVPGGPELLVILLIVLVPVALVAGLVYVVVFALRRGRERDPALESRVDALESRVETLEARRTDRNRE